MADLTVGSYLLQRVRQLGVKTLFGVPGDYELAFLDLVPEADLEWAGNPNELCASYAADGYGRINGVGALVTTFGPGELSALCGVAGAYCEFVPVVHIVGYPSVKAQNAKAILHHTLGDGKFTAYHEMSKHISCATTVLNDASTAVSEIDRCLNAMMKYSQPVYIGIPTDTCFAKVSSATLKTPIVTSLEPNNEASENEVVTEIRKLLESKSNPIIIVDGGAVRHQVLPEVSQLIEVTPFPVFTTPMGKGAVDEKHPRFGGLYGGGGSLNEGIIKTVETSEAILWIGNYPSDFNTGEFSEEVKPDVTINFERFYVTIGPKKYDVKMKYVLQKLISSLKEKPLAVEKKAMPCSPLIETPPKQETAITQDWIWNEFGTFLKAGDLMITETGTSSTGMNATPLASGVSMYTQEVFGSIGYATGSAVGAAKAVKELSGKYKRFILVTGDGSLQLTVQAFSDLLRHDLKPIIFVINNGGYTVERTIHGLHAPYNDIPDWTYTGLLSVFGPGYKSKTYQVRTSKELQELFVDPTFNAAEVTQLVEVFMDKYDAPRAMRLAGAAVDKFNAS